MGHRPMNTAPIRMGRLGVFRGGKIAATGMARNVFQNQVCFILLDRPCRKAIPNSL